MADYLIPNSNFSTDFSPVNTSAWTQNGGITQKSRDTWDLIFKALKEIGLPVLAILKGSGAAVSDEQIINNPDSVVASAAGNPSTLNTLKTLLDQKQRNADTPKGYSIDFSSPTTYLVGFALGFALWLLLKK